MLFQVNTLCNSLFVKPGSAAFVNQGIRLNIRIIDRHKQYNFMQKRAYFGIFLVLFEAGNAYICPVDFFLKYVNIHFLKAKVCFLKGLVV